MGLLFYLVVIAKAVVVDGVVVHQLQHEVVILLPVPIYVNNNIFFLTEYHYFIILHDLS